jgi:hypothetical protein
MNVMDNVNFELQELAAMARLEAVDILYEQMKDEYLCSLFAEYTMTDSGGCEFDA